MEPKSIAFYTAVAISLLAVTSATIFPTLVQIAQATVAEDDANATDGSETTEEESTDVPEQNPEASPDDDVEDNDNMNTDQAQVTTEDNDNDIDMLALDEVIACGTTITQSGEQRLNTDLNCPAGDGIIIRANDFTLDLNGHTIRAGNEAGVSQSPTMNYDGDSGIVVLGDNVAIEGEGQILDFDKAINIVGSEGGKVAGVTMSGNDFGLVVSDSVEIQVHENNLNGNGVAAVYLRTDDSTFGLNQVMNNRELGTAYLSSDRNVFAGNNVMNNGGIGVHFDPESNENLVNYNIILGHKADIDNAGGLSPSINQNMFGTNNICETSLPPGLCQGQG